MPTTLEILNLAPIASYLAANANDKGSLFRGGKLNPILPQQIYAAWYILQKIYDEDPVYDGLDAAAKYLWELMGVYGVRAQGVTGGGGSVTPITPILTPDELHFEVAADTPLVTGATTADLSAYGYRGFNILFSRNNLVQSTVPNGVTTYYSWNSTLAVLTLFNGAAQEDELFDIYPIR